jgi:hypothetical protein
MHDAHYITQNQKRYTTETIRAFKITKKYLVSRNIYLFIFGFILLARHFYISSKEATNIVEKLQSLLFFNM